MAWNSLSSTNRHSECGDSGASVEFQDMLDATSAWLHVVNEVHWAVLDLGSDKDIKKLRFKRFGTNNPTDMDIYITTSLGTGGDDATWGTAVATAVDIQAMDSSWTEIDVTDKTGRYIYFHINGTQHASDFLAWGDSTEKVIEYWDGDIPKRYKTVIPMRGIYTNNFSTSFNPTDGRYGLIPWDGSKYNNIVAAYIVATGKRTGTSGADPNPMWIMELYDRTSTIQIGQASGGGTTYETAISGDISANLPSGVATLDVRYKQQDSSSSQHTNFELHIIQENEDTGNKTRVYIPVGSYKNSPLTGYNTFGAALGASTLSEHHFKWLDADWATLSAAHFSATLRALSGKTVSLKLDDIAAGGALATFTHNTTTYTLKTSADISGSLVDDTTYTPFIKTSATPVSVGDICSNAFIIVDITDPDKLITFQDVGILGNSTTSAGWIEDISQQVRYLTGSEYYFDITEVVKYQGVAKHVNDTSMSVGVYDDGTRDSAADLITTATVNTLLESGAITPADGSEMTFAYNLTTAGFLKSGAAKNGMLAIYLTDLGVAGGIAYVKTLTETISLTEALIKSTKKTFAENISITDLLTKNTKKTFSDSINITDTIKYIIARTLTETINIADSITKSVTRLISDVLSLSDTIIKVISRVLTDGISITEIFSRIVIFIRTLTDSINITDTISKKTARVLNETISIIEVFISSVIISRILTETISLTDTIVKKTKKVFSENIGITEIFNRVVTFVRTLTDSITITDTISKLTIRVLVEAVSIIEAFISHVFIKRILTDTISLTDTIIKGTKKILSDNISITDTIGRILTKILTETISIIEIFITRAVFQRILTDTINVADTIFKSTKKVFTENISITDTIGKILKRTLTEVISIIEIFITSTIIIRILTDTINVTDTIIKGTKKVFAETIILADIITNKIVKIIIDTISIAEEFIIVSQIHRTLTEVISIGDTIFKKTVRTISDIFSLSDTIKKATKKVLTETLSIIDTITKAFVGVMSGVAKTILSTKSNKSILNNTVDNVTRLATKIKASILKSDQANKNIVSSKSSKSVIINKENKTPLNTGNRKNILSSENSEDNKQILTSLNSSNVVKSNKDTTTRLGTKNNKTNL